MPAEFQFGGGMCVNVLFHTFSSDLMNIVPLIIKHTGRSPQEGNGGEGGRSKTGEISGRKAM